MLARLQRKYCHFYRKCDTYSKEPLLIYLLLNWKENPFSTIPAACFGCNKNKCLLIRFCILFHETPLRICSYLRLIEQTVISMVLCCFMGLRWRWGITLLVYLGCYETLLFLTFWTIIRKMRMGNRKCSAWSNKTHSLGCIE